MNEELSPKTVERLGEILQRVLDRLGRARWAASRRKTDGSLDVVWTELGAQRAIQLQNLFEELGPEMDGNELSALLSLIRFMSPGATDSLVDGSQY